MSNNLKALRTARGWTQDQASEALGTTRNYYVKLESSTRPLGERWIKAAAKVFGVDPGDVISALPRPGTLVTSFDPDAPHAEAPDDGIRAASTEGRVNIRPGAIPEFDLRAGASYGGGYALPAQVSNGDRTYAADVVKAEWIFPLDWLRGEMRLSPAFTDLIAIDGPSMSPDLEPGDRVLIDRTSRDPKLEAMYAIRDGDSVIVKHVQLVRDGSEPPKIVCRSSNPKYEPFTLVLDGHHVEIIGRVAGRFTRT